MGFEASPGAEEYNFPHERDMSKGQGGDDIPRARYKRSDRTSEGINGQADASVNQSLDEQNSNLMQMHVHRHVSPVSSAAASFRSRHFLEILPTYRKVVETSCCVILFDAVPPMHC